MVAAYAQAPTGTILGTITDSSGAAVQTAVITVSNQATGTARKVAPNPFGLYNVPALQAGEYEVRIEAAGFQTVVRPATVQVGQNTTVDVSLTLGSQSQVVTVEAATAQVSYDSNSIQDVVTRQVIQELPLNGRSSLQLASLEPGVQVQAGSVAQFNAITNVVMFGYGGATGGSGVGPITTMDGGTINDEMEGGTSMNFSQEVVQEFQISQVNFDAPTGVSASGAINIVTRSGGNDFHGSAYLYYRDHNMAAYPSLQRLAIAPNPFFVRRNPGFWLGGPIKKDKLFFFVNYEYLNQVSVLSEKEDLPSLSTLSGIWASPYHYNLFNARFDDHLSARHTLFVRYSHDGNQGFGPYALTPQPAEFNYNYNWSDQSIMGLTSVVTPNLVNDFRFQYHFWENNVTDSKPSDCQFPCIGYGLPSIFMVGSSTYYSGTSVNSPQFRQARAFQFTDGMTWQKGKHRIRFGIDFEHMKTKVAPWDFCDPGCVYIFSPETIRGLGLSSFFPNLPTTITSTADLLNLPIYNLPSSIYSGIGVGNGTFPGLYDHNQGGTNNRIHPYFTDSWKVRPSFTVNFGLGYFLETGLFYSNLSLPQYLAPIVEGQTGGVPYGLNATPSNKLDFAPQFGFAWALGQSRKTVIRGGAGLYWDTQPIWQHFREGASIGPPGDGRTTLAGSAFSNTFPGIINFSTRGLLPVGAPLPLNTLTSMTFGQFLQIVNQQLPALQQQLAPAPPASGSFPVAGIQLAKQGIEIYPSKFPLLRSYQTSIGIQRELGHDMVLTVDWARRQGENVSLGELDLNRSGRYINGVPTPVIPSCPTAVDFNPTDECSTGTITFWVPEGRTVYDGMLAKLQKRFSHRFLFQASYALQKNLVENAAVNLNNYFAAYGPNLPRHNLNIAGTIDLPVGMRLSINSSIVSSTPITPIVSGVDLNGAGTTNFPITEAVPANMGLSYNCFNQGCGKTDLANAVAYWNSHLAGTKDARGITIPTLALPPNYALGTPIFSQDFRLTKEFVFKERIHFSIFGEVFNAFNIANLQFANITLDAAAAAGARQTYAFGQPTARLGQVFGSAGPRAEQIGARFQF
ncbi:MAG TPA: carboxypeptidase-like regulatory domain-containing protein [Bryobacteraceae bacterium]